MILNTKLVYLVLYTFLLLITIMFYSVDITGISVALLLIFLSAWYLFNHNSIVPENRKLFLTLIISSIVITCLFFSGIGSAIHTINLIIASIILNTLIVSEKEYIILHTIYFLGLFLFLFTFDMATLKIGYSKSIIGYSVNSNTFGIVALCTYYNFICLFNKISRKYFINSFWLMDIISFIFAVYVIAQSYCRSALLSLLFFGICKCILRTQFLNSSYKFICRFLLIIGLLFPFVYLSVCEHYYGYIIEREETINANQAKSMFSRVSVWSGTIFLIKEFPILGSANAFQISEDGLTNKKSESCHSMMLGLWKMFGIIPTIGVIYFIVYNKNIIIPYISDDIAKLAFIASLVIGFFESFLTDSNLMVLYLPFLLNKISYKYEQRSCYDS